MKDIKKMNNEELLELHPVIIYKAILNKEIRNFPDGFWVQTDPNFKFRVKEILDYLIDVYLRIDEEEFAKIVSSNFLKKYKLSGLNDRFTGKTMAILNIAYPGKYSITKLRCYRARLPKIRSDIKWLLDLFKDMPKFQLDIITVEDFYDNNLGYIFDSGYYPKTATIYDIVGDIYPEGLKEYGYPNKKGGK